MQTLLGHRWHHLSSEEIITLSRRMPAKGWIFLKSNIARSALAKRADAAQGASPLVRFLLQFNNPLIYILLASR